jgi:hypothetical protein
MITIFTLLLVLAPQQPPAHQVSDAKKKEFIELMKRLPHNGEFFSDEAIKTAGLYLPTLLALTEEDIEGFDIYPFAALSRGLCDDKGHRRYAIDHFAEIRHPMLKLFWAAMLFDTGKPPAQIIRFLQDALKSEAQAKLLAEMVGPDFADFKRHVNAAPKRRRKAAKESVDRSAAGLFLNLLVGIRKLSIIAALALNKNSQLVFFRVISCDFVDRMPPDCLRERSTKFHKTSRSSTNQR